MFTVNDNGDYLCLGTTFSINRYDGLNYKVFYDRIKI